MSSSPTVGPGTATAAAVAAAPSAFSTPALLMAMLRASTKISDLFFSPGKPPMIEVNGRLNATGPRALTATIRGRLPPILSAITSTPSLRSENRVPAMSLTVCPARRVFA